MMNCIVDFPICDAQDEAGIIMRILCETLVSMCLVSETDSPIIMQISVNMTAATAYREYLK